MIDNFVKIIGNAKVKMTIEGGLAIKLTNKTGSPSVKGELVTPSSSVQNAVSLAQIDGPDIIGSFYEDGIVDGDEAWIVIAGIADVYFIGNTTTGQFARMCATGDTGLVNGRAISEALPVPPFATDKHFQEIGHVIETRTGAGLAKIIMHFN